MDQARLVPNLREIKTFLFDLDGTLLPMDMDRFVKAYLSCVSKYVEHLFEPRAFVSHLWAATSAMLENLEPQRKNETVFWEHFAKLLNHPREALEPMFETFYRTRFSALVSFTSPSPLAPKVLSALVERGREIVLATNPVFPEIATRERMRWAGIDSFPWQLITTYENSRYCKPHPQYYLDILAQIGRQPHECVMIGNDVQEDISAAQVGMHTFLVTDCLIDKGHPAYSPTWRGTLAELYELLRTN